MIEIRSGKMSARLAPELGGAVLSLAYDGRDILRPCGSEEAVAADPREAACYPCVPWFGRIYGALEFGGEAYDLAPTFPACDHDHALHGYGWVGPWRVIRQSPEMLACRFDYAPQPGGFPFSFSAGQAFAVGADSFSVELSVTNTGARAMPAGLGLHPFFPRGPATRLAIAGPIAWIMPNEPPPSAFALKSGKLPDDTADISAANWDGDALITQDDMRIRLTADAPVLHLYAPARQPFFCIEPVTHLPGAFGADILSPGETKKIKMQIRR